MINYNEFTGEIVIEWHEKKDQKAAPIYHSFNRLPSMAQLHPKDPAKVIRAHFEGAMPSWMKDYAKAHDYKCNSTQLDGKFGWWIANWNAYKKGEKPFSAPTIKGAVRQLSQHIPNAYAEGQERILENLDNIARNLRNYPTAFIPFGVYYRPEEVKGEHGCLLLDDIILQQESNESPEDYRSRILTDGKLDTLIFELSTPLPDPEPQEEIEEEAVQSNKEEDEIPHQDEMKIEAEEGMPEEFLLDDLEELPMAEFSFDEMPMEEFSFGEELPASNSSSETVLETQSEEQNAEAFSIENEEMIVVEMDSEKTADQVEDLPIQNEEMVIEGSETIEHVDLTEQEAVGENMKMVEEKEEEVVEEKQATPEPDPIPAPTTKKPTSSRKNGKNNAIFGEAKAAGNKSVSADQFSLF